VFKKLHLTEIDAGVFPTVRDWIASRFTACGSFAIFTASRRASSRGLEIKHGDKRL
jgi:hypothetical protein